MAARIGRAHPRLVVVAPLIGGVDAAEAGLDRQARQPLRLQLLPGGAVEEAGHRRARDRELASRHRRIIGDASRAVQAPPGVWSNRSPCISAPSWPATRGTGRSTSPWSSSATGSPIEALNRRVNRLANALLAAGLAKGDKVATVLPNCLEQIEVYCAVAKCGLVAVPLSPLLQEAGLVTLLGNSDAKLVISTAAFTATLDRARAQVPGVRADRWVLIEGARPGYRGL